jgi:hypothetical protein
MAYNEKSDLVHIPCAVLYIALPLVVVVVTFMLVLQFLVFICTYATKPLILHKTNARKKFCNTILACIVLRNSFQNGIPMCSVTKIPLVIGIWLINVDFVAGPARKGSFGRCSLSRTVGTREERS